MPPRVRKMASASVPVWRGFDLGLERNPGLRGDGAEALVDDGVICAADGEHGAAAEAHIAVLRLRGLRGVGRVGDVHHDGDVGFHAIRGHGRAVEAVFLLNERARDDAGLQFAAALRDAAQGLGGRPCADAVVAAARGNAVAEQRVDACRVGDRVTHGDHALGLGARAGADVDREVFDLGHFLRSSGF